VADDLLADLERVASENWGGLDGPTIRAIAARARAELEQARNRPADFAAACGYELGQDDARAELERVTAERDVARGLVDDQQAVLADVAALRSERDEYRRSYEILADRKRACDAELKLDRIRSVLADHDAGETAASQALHEIRGWLDESAQPQPEQDDQERAEKTAEVLAWMRTDPYMRAAAERSPELAEAIRTIEGSAPDLTRPRSEPMLDPPEQALERKDTGAAERHGTCGASDCDVCPGPAVVPDDGGPCEWHGTGLCVCLPGDGERGGQ
jgi:hypothetical protein